MTAESDTTANPIATMSIKTPWFVALAVGLAAPSQVLAQAAQRDTTQSDSIVTLDPIRVTVTRADRALDLVPHAVSVVDRQDIQLGRVTAGLDEALAAFPGIVVANRYNQSLDQRISIRGFGARSAFGVRGIKVLLDGVPQTLPDGQGQLTNIELADVGRIEILRGASSSLYGNASGGVISIWSDSRRPPQLEPAAQLALGSYGLAKWVAAAGAPVGARGSFAITASRTTSDGFRAHSVSDQRRLEARLTQPLDERTTISVRAQLADSPTLDNPGALTAAELAADPSAADPRNVNADAGKAVTQAQVSARIEHQFVAGGRATATVFGLRRDLENPLAFASIQLDRWTYGLRATSAIPIPAGASSHLLTVGVDAQWQRDDRLNFTPDRTEQTLAQLERVFELGPFVQAMMALTPRATLTAGARYDRIRFHADDRFLQDGSDDSGERVMSAVSATGGLTYEVHTAFVPYVNVGTSFETPTTTELVNRPEGAGGFNPELDPQRATNYEIGARGHLPGHVRYGAAVFYSDVRDQLIPFEVPDAPTRRFFRNAGSARHAGVEVELALRPTSGLQVLFAYTYANHRFKRFQTATDTFDGNEIPGVPRHYGHLSVRYRSSAGLWLAADNTYSSAYFADDLNSTETEWWFATGLRAGWDGTLGRWRLAPYIGVLNVFDREYVSSVVVNARGGRYFEPAPPRNFYIGLSVGGTR